MEKGTVRSYRLFDENGFSLVVPGTPGDNQFVETFPQSLTLRYSAPDQGMGRPVQNAELRVTLDMFEMLKRLAEGYQPNLEEQQGFYLSLTVFKNVLASAPYQEVLLTETGHQFFRIRRDPDGTLTLADATEEYTYGNQGA